MRTLISAIGLFVAVTATVLLPAGYLYDQYTNHASTLAFKAELNASRLAKYIYAHDALWQFQSERLAELIEFTKSKTNKVRQRVFDAQENLVLEEGDALAAPVMMRSAPIAVAGSVVGRIEVATSLREILFETGLVSLLSLVLGLVIYFAVRVFPLRVLDRTLGELEVANRAIRTANEQLQEKNARFDAALNNMSQGLCMFDASARLLVCNERYLQMYALSSELVKPGCTLHELLHHRQADGSFTGNPEQYIADLLAETGQGKTFRIVVELVDGRVISLVNSPMAGGGWVSTHEDITERRLAEVKIAHLAHHDALTGLPNRVLFREQMEQSLAHLRRDEILAVLCLDLDHFKSVNDTLGHPVGDKLLRAVSARLRECLRETDVVARLGGDEFAIVQASKDQPKDVTALAARIIDAISAPFDLDEQQVVVGASVGISVAPGDGTNPDQLLMNADMALYRAKDDGRGTYRFFEPGMDARMQARRILELDLRKAIANREFELYYQPLIQLDTERIACFEALLRWRHPLRGLIEPLEFIPLAEDTGLIVPIGEWVLRQACAEAATWPHDIKVAVNLSPVQFKSRNLVQTVITALAASGLPASRLELEITENVLLQDNEVTLATLHRLRGLGVKIAMDDFGSGYSSLSYLRSFPFDKIKIDRAYISEMSDKDDSMAIVRAVTGIGSSLGIATTAEGVETREQLDRLRLEGCTEVQGYYFSPPRPAKEIQKLLARTGAAIKAVA